MYIECIILGSILFVLGSMILFCVKHAEEKRIARRRERHLASKLSQHRRQFYDDMLWSTIKETVA